jgi:hypothetical protein
MLASINLNAARLGFAADRRMKGNIAERGRAARAIKPSIPTLPSFRKRETRRARSFAFSAERKTLQPAESA